MKVARGESLCLGVRMSIDQNYQNTVDLEADHLARLSGRELMSFKGEEKTVSIGDQKIKISYLIQDLGDRIHIGVFASRKNLFGNKKYFSGVFVELNIESRRMTQQEAINLYD